MKTRMRIWGSLVLAALVVACGGQEQERSATGDELRATVDSLAGTDYFSRQELRPGQQQDLERFYRDRNYEPAWNQPDSLLPVVDSLLVALESKAILQSLHKLLPTHRQYGLLKAQLARYRAAAGGAAGNTSATGPRTAGHLSDDQLRNRLAFYGLVDTTRAVAGEPGDPDRLGAALKQFQQLNGLDTTGVVDDSTRVALNRPVAEVIQTFRINLERLRWQPENLGDRYVAVNVPGSELKVYENGAEALHMRVIVGNEYAVTPIFTDTLEYIIFSPDWTIPLTIARNEILPVLGRNPNSHESNLTQRAR